ncbi:MAG TPA: tetratricopeptide repeat protein [Polyangiaceae bacterium]|nr:tetratricopeptide repeat protein [Polyangiaceae bacterium]
MSVLNEYLRRAVASEPVSVARLRSLVERYRLLVRDEFAGESMGAGDWKRHVWLIERGAPVRLGEEIIEEHGYEVLVPYVIAERDDLVEDGEGRVLDEDEVRQWCGGRLFVLGPGGTEPRLRDARDEDLPASYSYRPTKVAPLLEAVDATPDLARETRALLYDGCVEVFEILPSANTAAPEVDDGSDEPLRTLYDRALALAPTDVRLLRERAELRLEGGDLSGAITDYDAALRVAPDDVSLLVDRGMVRSDAGDSTGAITDYTRALELEPRAVRALNNRAYERLQLGDTDAALNDVKAALALAPDDVLALCTLAEVHAARGDADAAIDALTRAAVVNPGDVRRYAAAADELAALRDDPRFRALVDGG